MIKGVNKIVVLGGGVSTERQVSVLTSVSVCKALRNLGYKAIFVDLYLGLENYVGELQQLFDDENGLCDDVKVEKTLPNMEEIKSYRTLKSNSRIGKNVIEICKLADCVFIGLHGIDGEDGKIQACLDLYGIPYTGTSILGSALATDKFMAKQIMLANNILVAPIVAHAPCVVKFVHGGSSIGTFICNTEEELSKIINKKDKFDDDFFVEEKISGTEITVPVLDGKALLPIEIIPPKSGKFDYIAKYQSGEQGAIEICPARLSKNKMEEVQRIAERIHKALKLSVYSRADFIMDNNGLFWCLEVNTLPGMTPNSLIPKSARAVGIDYPHLCEQIIELSLKERLKDMKS